MRAIAVIRMGLLSVRLVVVFLLLNVVTCAAAAGGHGPNRFPYGHWRQKTLFAGTYTDICISRTGRVKYTIFHPGLPNETVRYKLRRRKDGRSDIMMGRFKVGEFSLTPKGSLEFRDPKGELFHEIEIEQVRD